VTDRNPALDAAFLEGLFNENGWQRLDEHIRAAGTASGYFTRWCTARDAAAREQEITPEIAARVLALPVEDWKEGATVRSFLLQLLTEVWADQWRYDIGGDSDWRYYVYSALLAAGLIGAWRDGYGVGYRPDGSSHPEDLTRADALVTAAIAALYTR